MAVTINSGDLIFGIILRQPAKTTNTQGGREVAYTDKIITRAAIRELSSQRASDPQATALLNSKDFYIRWSQERQGITKDWIIEYDSEYYTINEIQKFDQDRQRFIRINAKVKTDG